MPSHPPGGVRSSFFEESEDDKGFFDNIKSRNEEKPRMAASMIEPSQSAKQSSQNLAQPLAQSKATVTIQSTPREASSLYG